MDDSVRDAKPSSGVGVSRRTVLAGGVAAATAGLGSASLAHAQRGGETGVFATLLSGEPTHDSVIVQARFASALPPVGDTSAMPSPGVAGSARIEASTDPRFAKSITTAWLPVGEEGDFIGRAELRGLDPDTIYHYRASFRTPTGKRLRPAATGLFRTLPLPDGRERVSFAVFSCLSYALYFGTGRSVQSRWPWATPAQGQARQRGYPAMDLIRRASPNFMVATGDTVYYDHPNGDRSIWATTVPQMRAMWHRQFAVPTVREALASTPVYWQKDDHDFRFDDADNTGAQAPSPADGRSIFEEQVALPREARIYRTHRINRHLQIWLLEGRDFRSPNATPDTPAKTLWGAEQREWLERTLLASNADFKVIISPTPLVGPDDIFKGDGHASPKGFRNEGEAFLAFLRDRDLISSTFIVNGDRHWKYHSIHPTGVEEFSCGTIHRQNSRPGVAPGDPRGTDREGRIRQPYLQPIPDGGFLQIDVEADSEGDKATMLVRFWGENGQLQHAVRRFGKRPIIRLGDGVSPKAG